MPAADDLDDPRLHHYASPPAPGERETMRAELKPDFPQEQRP